MVRKCLLLSQRNNNCKNCIKMKNVNVHHYLFLSETYELVARTHALSFSTSAANGPNNKFDIF
jgi:hypothetical protein